MRFRITLVGYTDSLDVRTRDVALTSDVTATVGEIACVLVRAGAGSAHLLPIAIRRWAPLTLRVERPGEAPLILDPGDPIAASGLQSGTRVEPVLDARPGTGVRTRATVATLTVADGPQTGVRFAAVSGRTTIGRERGSRVELRDKRVSRHHAALVADGGRLTLEDLGSANGTSLTTTHNREQHSRELTPGSPAPITDTSTLILGGVRVSIEPAAPSEPDPPRRGTVHHLSSPFVEESFQPESVELPTPVEASRPTHFPTIALIAPALMGLVLFTATGSAASLLFIALSPLLILGAWANRKLEQRRTLRVEQRQFATALAAAEQRLAKACEHERAVRESEQPDPGHLLTTIREPGREVWCRRPEHRSFLRFRLGHANQASRTQVIVPARKDLAGTEWEAVTALANRFATIPDVPVLERLDECGALGITGPVVSTDAVTRALLVQLLALHSPAVFTLACLASAEQSTGAWAWLKWLPHVDSPYSPFATPHLAADELSANQLLAALEALLQERSGEQKKPAVLLLVLHSDLVDRARLVDLAERGPDAGVHVLWVAPRMHQVPAACRTTIEVESTRSRVHLVQKGSILELTRLESLGLAETEQFARSLAPLIDAGARVLDESDLPRHVAIEHTLPKEVLTSSHAVINAWERNGSIASRWRSGGTRAASDLTGVVGQGDSGLIEIDLRAQGPHALIGGTTGAGKSEFLQTWILSLAARYSPDRLTFLLIDYKGGAAFADCVSLPHTVGLVTDLDAHLVRRALVSLRAELRHRESILAAKHAKDVMALEQRGDPDTPPALVIIVDEFAALVGQIPEFLDGLIDVAQRGRSLGLHLIMATQRPAGVIRENLRANTNLRIGLRMADPQDSRDVLGVADAAHFPLGCPGRAMLRVGSAAPVPFQTAYASGHSSVGFDDAAEVHDLGFGIPRRWFVQPEISLDRDEGRGPRDIERLVAQIRDAAHTAGISRPRRPWIDPLPALVPLLDIHDDLLADAQHPCNETSDDSIRIGLLDEPVHQRQGPYSVSLSAVGGIAVFGGPGSGKTTALLTISHATVTRDPRTVLYGVDASDGLQSLAALPGTGEIVRLDESDRVMRLLRLIRRLISERQDSTVSQQTAPVILLLIDGFDSFRDTYDLMSGGTTVSADLIEIINTGRRVGVHVIIASERARNLPAALAAGITERLVLRLPDERDYAAHGVTAGVFDDAPPGRAIRPDGSELQFAVPGSDSGTEALQAATIALSTAQITHQVAAPPRVPPVPMLIARSEIPEPSAFGIDTAELRAVTIPESGLLLVTGPAGSGRTTAIRSLVAAVMERAEGSADRSGAYLISPRRSELRGLLDWSAVADDGSKWSQVIGQLNTELGEQTHTPAPSPVPPVGASPPLASRDAGLPHTSHEIESGERAGLIVVEDIGGFEGTGVERELAGLLRTLRRCSLLTIVEGENATLGAVWELSAPLKGVRWALALRPDANDAPSILTATFAHARRQDFPPGRGFLLQGGALTGVHVAYTDQHTIISRPGSATPTALGVACPDQSEEAAAPQSPVLRAPPAQEIRPGLNEPQQRRRREPQDHEA